jgi:branched-chain amino acid transport system ATP-binding protein
MSDEPRAAAATGPDGDRLVLEARKVTRRFGGLVAVREVDFTVGQREIRGLIGPNGAGKTTFFNCITGIFEPSSGEIVFNGRRINGLPPDRITRLGIARTFQNLRLFGNMTALENVMVGRHSRTREGVFGAVLRTAGFRREEQESRDRGMELLDFVGLRGKEDETAHNLSYGDMRRLEIARALATEPKLLLLDEPTAGMGLEDVDRTIALVKSLSAGRTVVFVDHNMHVVGSLADRVTVLQSGQVLAEGPYDQVRADERVITAYLGAVHE